MKNPSVIARDRLRAAKLWVFRWRGLDGTPMRGFLALTITAGLFAIFGATVRIRVSAPQQWIERKASIIHLPSDGDGARWALRATEGGPFPSRFDPREWEKSLGLSDQLAAAVRWTQPGYQPELRDLPPSKTIETPELASKSPVFPRRKAVPVPPPVAAAPTKLVPMLFPLSGGAMDALPSKLPPFEPKIDEALAAGAWRFLIRLQPDGVVAECVPMLDQAGGDALAAWLRGVHFGPELAKKSPWIGVGVGFINQSTDGPDAR